MRTFAVAAAFALASVATAQLDNIPSCALSCFLGPLGSDGCSELTDFACHCKKSDTLLASVTPCVQGACSAEDQAATIAAVEQTCADAGVPIEVPEPGASSSAAPESSATPTPEPSSSAAESSYAESTPTPEPTTTTPVSSVSGYPTPSSNGTVPSASPSVSEFPGAAARATQAAGLLGAAALAIIAL